MPEKYEDNLWYPVVIGNKIREMKGSDIKAYLIRNSAPAQITELQWQEALRRIDTLERTVEALLHPQIGGIKWTT